MTIAGVSLNGADLTTSLDLSTLEAHLWESANILRGPVDAADFKTYIFPLLFFKRISDVYDEETALALEESGGDQEYALFPENHRFQIPPGCHWNDVRARTSNVGQALQRALREIEKANQRILIDGIVRIVRFPGWQQTIAGEREVQKALRKTLLKYQLHREQELFDRSYAYIKEYY